MKKLLLLVPVALAFAFTVALTLVYGHSIGVDIHYHVAVAEQYATGNFADALGLMLNMNRCFYPPLFHLLLVPSVWFGVPLAFTGALQILFLPLALGSLGFLLYREHGLEGGLVGMLVVMGSWAYVDRVIAVQPQGLDFILLPLVYLFVKEGQNMKVGIIGTVLLYNHGVVNMANLLVSFATKLRQRANKLIGLVVLAVSPMLIATAYYLPSALEGYGASMLVDQQLIFWTEPLEFWVNYVRLPVVGFAVAIYLVVLWRSGRFVSALSKLSILSLILSAVMLVVWADRFGQYATIPLSILFVDGYLRIKDRMVRSWMFLAVLVFTLILYGTLWFMLLNKGFQS